MNAFICLICVGIENMESACHVANALIAIHLYPVFNELSFVQCEYNYRYS